MSGTDTLSIRIPEKVKKRMKEIDLDWPGFLREAIENKIKEIERKKAFRTMDVIRSKTKYGTFDSTESIREDRDAR